MLYVTSSGQEITCSLKEHHSLTWLKVNGTTLSHPCLQLCVREGAAACGPKAKSIQENEAIDWWSKQWWERNQSTTFLISLSSNKGNARKWCLSPNYFILCLQLDCQVFSSHKAVLLLWLGIEDKTHLKYIFCRYKTHLEILPRSHKYKQLKKYPVLPHLALHITSVIITHVETQTCISEPHFPIHLQSKKHQVMIM